MSREYQEYCHACREWTARSDVVWDHADGRAYKLYQCLNLDCGKCFVKVTKPMIELKTKADFTRKRSDEQFDKYKEKIWKDASHEVFEIIDENELDIEGTD